MWAHFRPTTPQVVSRPTTPQLTSGTSLPNLAPRTERRHKFMKLARSFHTASVAINPREPWHAYLLACESSGITPEPHLLLNENLGSVALGGRRMGDVRAEAVAVGRMHMDSPGKVNLRSNRLTGVGATHVLQKLPTRNILLLDLARNSIGEAGAASLCVELKVCVCVCV